MEFWFFLLRSFLEVLNEIRPDLRSYLHSKYFSNSVVTSLYSSFYCFFVSPIPGNIMYLPPTLVLTVIIHQKIHLQSRTWSFLAFFDRFVQNTAGNSGTRRTTRNELLVDELQAMHTTFATRKTIPYTAPGHDGNIAVFYWNTNKKITSHSSAVFLTNKLLTSKNSGIWKNQTSCCTSSKCLIIYLYTWEPKEKRCETTQFSFKGSSIELSESWRTVKKKWCSGDILTFCPLCITTSKGTVSWISHYSIW